MQNSNQKLEIKSLNTKIYDDFVIEELEERLETAPWICGVHGSECGVDGVDCGIDGQEEQQDTIDKGSQQ